MDQRGEAAKELGSGDVRGPAEAFDRDEREQQGLVEALITTFQHFFGSWASLFSGVADPRDPRKITYPLSALALSGVLMFLFRLQARREIALKLRNGGSSVKFNALFGVPRSPHGDTLENTFSRLKPDEVQETVCGLTESLIRGKLLYRYRLFGRYFVVAVDGTGTLTYHQRHCPHCLTRKVHGTTQFYHSVLEAKIVTPNGFAFTLMTEFIENPGENPTKQDCELKAFYRLEQRIRTRFPRLPISLALDGLFANGPVFEICRRHDWNFMVTLKDDDLPTINDEFRGLVTLHPENIFRWQTGENGEIQQTFRWVNDIPYVDTKGTKHKLSVVECLDRRPAANQTSKTTTFRWVTSTVVSATNVLELATNGGRIRWKLENEGFNVQKNGGYGLEHAYSQNPASAKVFYFLLQVAHMLAQLLEKGSLLRDILRGGAGSSKNLAFRILEAWRNARFTAATLKAILEHRVQIRFDST